jgi:hypothetical protein
MQEPASRREPTPRVEEGHRRAKELMKECDPSALSDTYENLRRFVLQCHLELMKRVRSGKSGARTSLLFFSNLSHAQRMTYHGVQLVKLLEKSEIGTSGGANAVPWRNEPAAAPSKGSSSAPVNVTGASAKL